MKHTTYDLLQVGWKHITYSVFESITDWDGFPLHKDWIVTDIRDEVAIWGTVLISAPPGWGVKGKEYLSTAINPTWRTLAEHADKSKEITQDFAHRFFEGFRLVKREDEKKEIELIFGS